MEKVQIDVKENAINSLSPKILGYLLKFRQLQNSTKILNPAVLLMKGGVCALNLWIRTKSVSKDYRRVTDEMYICVQEYNKSLIYEI